MSACNDESVMLVLMATAAALDIPLRSLISTLRRQDLVRARHIAMWLARQRYGVSLPNIGRTINRDHTTVLHGIRRAQKLMTEDRDFQRDLAEVIAYLDAPEAAQ